MLVDQIRIDLNEASKNRDVNSMQALRMLLSALEYKKMQKLAQLTPEEEIAVIKSEVKKRQEAIEIYQKANDEARAGIEKAELSVLGKYMPKQASEDEVRAVVKEVVASLGANANKGQVIGMVMGKIGKENVDGSIVARVVNEVLA